MMTRVSGEYGSGRQNCYMKILMARGSGSADPGVETVIWKIMMMRGSGSADPGVAHLFRGLYSQFYFWVHT